VGLTLSDAQAQWIDEKRAPEVTARVESWADHVPTSRYDAIVSIEAFEAFAKLRLPADDKLRVYRTFFERCHDWLRSGGRLSLQTIAYGNSGPEDFADFIANDVFPESDLPKLHEIAEAVERRFEVETLVNHRDHYARTLRCWRERLLAARDTAVREVGEPVVERYEEYLRLSEYMFSAGTCDLLRIGLRRIDHPRPTRRS
jgi:cyclopropane-fatty-acyl-phospholipid synthase